MSIRIYTYIYESINVIMIHNSPQLEMTQCLPIVKRMSTVICANKILSSTKKIIELTLYTAKDESNQMLKKEVKYKKKITYCMIQLM